MKTVAIWLVYLVLVGLQVTVGTSFGMVFALPIVAISLVVLSAFLQLEQLLYMALVGGLLLDFASGSNFGLHITLLLFVVLFGKLVLRLGKREQSLFVLVVLSGFVVVLYNFIQLTSVFEITRLKDLVSYMSQLGLQVVYGSIWTVLLYSTIVWINRSEWLGKIASLKWIR